MILKNCGIDDFFRQCKNKKVICYGIGAEFDRILKNFDCYLWDSCISWLADNDPDKIGKKFVIGSRIYHIKNLDSLLEEDLSDTVIFITCSHFAEIVSQLNTIPKLRWAECYIYYFMYSLDENNDICIKQCSDCHIPSVIHYCWFGGQELPDLYKRCIDSWHKFCPDYEVIEWNESNCNLNENLFAKQAYEKGKFGFVPDYFRLKIIYEHGGIYLDTDVELLRNIDDLRYNEAFCGLQIPGEAALGLGFGAAVGHTVIHKMLNRYQKMQFVKPDGEYEETISPVWQTMDLMELGMRYGNRQQNIDGMTIYPVEVLSPMNLITGEIHVTKNTYAIHHYDGSWITGDKWLKKKKRQADVQNIREMMEKRDV